MLALSALCTPEQVAQLGYREYAVLPHQVPVLWERVVAALSEPIPNLAALSHAISTITGKASSLSGVAAFQPRHALYQRFWTTAIGFMQRLVLRMGELFPVGDDHNSRLPLLKTGIEAQVTLTQEQIAALLSCSFFGAIVAPPESNGSFPEFALLFLMEDASFSPVLDCLIHYFCAIADAMPQGRVTFERKAWRSEVRWGSREEGSEGALPLCPVDVFKSGTIEDSGSLIHADFANQFIGGGVLEGGRVQEEILFSIKPECLVSMLFCSVMKPFESITITGAQRFTSYSGYGRSFRCAGFYQDETPLDEHQRRRCLIIAMDAVVAFGGKQWDDDKIERDIVKALCAFSRSPIGPESTPPTSPTSDLWSTLPEDNGRIATGNWGCGAFGGDKGLKFMQQWAAASIARREGLQYFTFGESYQGADLEDLIRRCSEIAQARQLVVADLHELIKANKERNLFTEFFAKYPQA